MGPSPFRFFNSWLNNKDCISLIETKLGNDQSYGWARYSLNSKLRNLKPYLRAWHIQNDKHKKESEARILHQISLLDAKE